jgi:S-DNA-T family DNA segregation ATPase FtsK/SpoIIIE
VRATVFPIRVLSPSLGHRPVDLVVEADPMAVVADLTVALGGRPGDSVVVDGRAALSTTSLQASGIRRGSLVELHPGATRLRDGGSAPGMCRAMVEVVAGPDAGRRQPLSAGRHVVGRGRMCDVALDDPAVGTHHALVAVTDDGDTTVTPLGGCRVETVDEAGRRATVSESFVWRRGVLVRVGRSVLAVGSAAPTPVFGEQPRGSDAAAGPSLDDDGRVVHHAARLGRRPAPPRAPGPPPEPQAVPLPPLTGAVPALLAVTGSAVLAVVIRQPTILLFGALAALTTMASTATGWIAAVQSRRRAVRQAESDHQRFVGEVRAHVVAVRRYHWAHLDGATQLAAVAGGDVGAVWAHRPDEGAPDAVVVGVGSGSWEPAVPGDAAPLTPVWSVWEANRVLDVVPVAIPLGPGAVVSIQGDPAWAAGVVRALVLQLCVRTAPGRLRLVWEPSRGGETPSWWRWLPHTALAVAGEPRVGGPALTLAVDGVGGSTRVVEPAAGSVPQGLRGGHHPGGECGTALVTVVPPTGTPRRDSTAVVRQRPDGSAVVVRPAAVHDHGHPEVELTASLGVSEVTAVAIAARLAGLRPSGGGDASAAVLPTRVDLTDVLDVDRSVAGWPSRRVDDRVTAVLGVGADGPVLLDLDRDGPHVLVAGTTGAGKSELLRTVVVSLAALCSPDELTFLLVDYKGGSAFDACAALPHVVGVVTDLDGHDGERVLASLEAELRRRERLLRAAAAPDLATYRRSRPLARLVLVIDEFATLTTELPGFVPSLVAVAQRGRSLGIHLVLATQRPGGAVTDDIRANTNTRIALRVHDRHDSLDVVGESVAAEIPRDRPGRAVARFGHGDLVVLQAAGTSGPAAEPNGSSRVLVRAWNSEAASAGGRASAAVTSGALVPSRTPPAVGPTVLEDLVERIGRRAGELGLLAPPAPWHPPLPAVLSRCSLGPGVVGVLDDPAEQTRRDLRWDPAEGHLAVVGALGAGCSTTLLSVAEAVTEGVPSEELHLYAVTARPGGPLDALDGTAHAGAVVTVGDAERLERLLHLLAAEVEHRSSGGGVAAETGRPTVVLLVDGFEALRRAVEARDPVGLGILFDDLVARGPGVGIVMAAADERAAGFGPAFVQRCAQRWVLRLAEASDGAAVGLPGGALVAGPAGRGVRAGDRLVFQIGVPSPAARTRGPRPPGAARPVGSLPETATLAEMRSAARAALVAGRSVGCDGSGAAGDGDVRLVVGLDTRTLQEVAVCLRRGDHLLVTGAARSGRSTTLATLAQQWHHAAAPGWVGLVGGGRRPAPVEAARVDLAGSVAHVVDAARQWAAHHPTGRALVVVDQAESVDDPGGALSVVVADPDGRIHLVAACRADTARQSYGTWIAGVRRGGVGLLLGRVAEIDTDALGVGLPRRHPVAPRAGRGWLVTSESGPVHVQVAVPDPPR